jgi:hypothetical protein
MKHQAHIITTLTALAASTLAVSGSSHREAPMITSIPKLDATDFYLFNSYEDGREDYVTIVANYLPLQDAYGGPNYFTLDTEALYEIHVDNDGDAVEDLTFQFDFETMNTPLALSIGPEGSAEMVAIPLINAGPITEGDSSSLLRQESYQLTLVTGDRRTGMTQPLASDSGDMVFLKPVDNIGKKSLPDYESYAGQYVYNIDLPGTDKDARVFVGQRKDPFVVNLGETFDLLNISTGPVGSESRNQDSLAMKNVTSLVIEVPKEFLTGGNESGIIGAWTTASKMAGDGYEQVSRLSNPLVNEVVIGLQDKDLFNASEPMNDGQFATYVTHPTLPALVELLFDVPAPTAIPRQDLVAAFLTGVDGLNANGSVAEMLRLNTTIAAVPADDQNRLGVIGGDTAGFPNGRRPGDDVVDIALRVVMGALLPEEDAPAGQAPFTDGAYLDASYVDDAFPYLKTPIAGSPNDLTPGKNFYRFAEKAAGGVYYYDDEFEAWLYTTTAGYPYFYDYSRGNWIYWIEGSFAPRRFYDLEAGAFFDVGS